MKTTQKIETNVETIQFGIWDEKVGKFIPITSSADGKINQTELLDAICFFVDNIKNAIREDLTDIGNGLMKGVNDGKYEKFKCICFRIGRRKGLDVAPVVPIPYTIRILSIWSKIDERRCK